MIAMPSTRRSPAFEAKIRHLALPLAPLVSVPTGPAPPDFPATLLNYWLLTAAQLDDIAHFYHQRTPGPWTQQYPCPIEWRVEASLEEKRRKIGRFIGLRGCESPVRVQSEEEIAEEVRAERERVAEEEAFRGKRKWF